MTAAAIFRFTSEDALDACASLWDGSGMSRPPLQEHDAEAAAILYQFLGALTVLEDTDESRRLLLDHYADKARAWGNNHQPTAPLNQPEESCSAH